MGGMGPSKLDHLSDPPKRGFCHLKEFVVAAISTYTAWINDPAYWYRPDDTKKMLPDQWARHHSNWRFVNALVCYIGPPTHTLGHIVVPLATVIVLCVGIKYAEGKVAWELDQYNNYSRMYRYSSFVLSLLLAFRLNRTYDRWWNARCAFGGIGGGVVNVLRQVVTWNDDPVLHRQVQKWGMCMVYGMVQLVRNTPKVTDPRVKLLLDPDELALYESTTKPAKLCGSMLSALVAKAGLDSQQEVYLNEMLGMVAANCGTVARIKLQAMPFGMTLFTTGWTYIWLLILPFGIYPEASWSALLPVFMMATMMLSLEDLANQMEEPFRFFPYEAMVATTAKDMPRTVREVQDCKAMIAGKYQPAMGLSGPPEAAGLPPFPVLKPLPQL